MNKINIEAYENEKKANYKIYINDKLEFDVKGFRYDNTSDLMDEISRSYERYVTTRQPETRIIKGPAKFAGLSEVSQAIAMIPVNTSFTTKDITRMIVPETSSKFTQTNANVSANFSVFKKANYYPNWLEVLGMCGRSREYRKTKNVTAKDIVKDIRNTAKKIRQ